MQICHSLNPQQMLEVRELESRCAEGASSEAISFCPELNFHSGLPPYYLLYGDGGLESFLYLFEPMSFEAEVYGFTLPSLRRQRRFSDLFSHAAAELSRFGIKKAVFVAKASGEGEKAARAMGARHVRSEFLMQLMGEPARPAGAVQLRPVSEKNAETAAKISSLAFGEPFENSLVLTNNVIASPGKDMYIIQSGEAPVGVMGLSRGENPMIFGLCILPGQRRRGYARAALYLAAATLSPLGRGVYLEVNSANRAALKLYASFGFAPVCEYKYLSLAI